MDRRTYPFEGVKPDIHDEAHVSREATLIGDVTVDAGASVWPGVVLRGDVGPVVVGQHAHVGDNAVVHAATIGDRVMVGHGAVLNDAVVDESTLVGFNSTLTSDVTVGEHCVIAAGTVVPDGFDIPPESFVRGVPAAVTPMEDTTLDPDELFDTYSSGEYTDLATRHDSLFE